MALDAVSGGLPPPSPGHPDVSGAVVDVAAQGGFATLTALTDGTTSLYTSGGGGTIGAGSHAAVAQATENLLSVLQAHLDAFQRPDDGSLPEAGMVRFHVLTPSGTRFEDVPEDSFWGRAPHELLPVIAATQQLITAVRETPGA